MINIVYVPGTFGSTIEYILRSHTKEYQIEPNSPLPDGSMHGFEQHAHLTTQQQLHDYFSHPQDPNNIVTISYPLRESNLNDILDYIKEITTPNKKNVLVYCDNFNFAEQNLLFQYHKIAFGNGIAIGLKTFADSDTHDFTGWNSNYKTWNDLKPWEFREWFSIFYPSFLKLQNNIPVVDDDFLVVHGSDILYNTVPTLLKIIKFCGLTVDRDLTPFVEEWQLRQQYILQEYKTVCTIVDCTIKKQPYTWTDLNIIAESIVQQQLRQHGFEIRCNGLDVFPINSLELHALLEPTWRTE